MKMGLSLVESRYTAKAKLTSETGGLLKDDADLLGVPAAVATREVVWWLTCASRGRAERRGGVGIRRDDGEGVRALRALEAVAGASAG